MTNKILRLFGTDGVRAKANGVFTPELALGLGFALGCSLRARGNPKPDVVVLHDPRPSSDMLVSALNAGLCSSGANVLMAGCLPTAAGPVLISEYGAEAGAVVTASHNPLEDNGLKLFDEDGLKYSLEAEADLEAMLPVIASTKRPLGLGVGRIRECSEDARERYISDLVRAVPPLGGMRFYVDCANGAAALIAGEVYSRAGGKPELIGNDRIGEGINNGVGALHLEHVSRACKGSEFVGFAHDGDADRLVGIDETGQLFDGADSLAVLAASLDGQGALASSTLATTLMTNSGLKASLAKIGIRVMYSDIGDRSVSRLIESQGLTLGGEQNGHVINRMLSTTGDGIRTALMLLSEIANQKSSLAQLRRVWSPAPQRLRNVPIKVRWCPDSNEAVQDELRTQRELLGDEGRIVVRISTIEPVMRIMCEAIRLSTAKRVVDALSQVVVRVDRERARLAR